MIDHNEIRIDCAPHSSGQHVSRNPNGVTVTHTPTGMTVTVLAKSQHQNRDIAMRMLEYGLLATGYLE